MLNCITSAQLRQLVQEMIAGYHIILYDFVLGASILPGETTVILSSQAHCEFQSKISKHVNQICGRPYLVLSTSNHATLTAAATRYASKVMNTLLAIITVNWCLGSLDCMWGVQTHSGSLALLVPFRNDLARMKGIPQPTRKLLPALGIKAGSFNDKSQPLTIGPFLIPWKSSVFIPVISLLLMHSCPPIV